MRPRFPRIPRRALPPRVWRWIFAANLAAALIGGGWYLFQPAGRQAEVDRLVTAALARDKRVGFLEVAWDVWDLYYASSGAGAAAPGDNRILYGGQPRPRDPGEVLRVLVNQGYVVGYSDALGLPRWAAYRVGDLPRIPPPPPRPDRFTVDRRTAARVEPQVYSGSGYDRGHLAPNFAIATRHGAAAQRETFLMSNIAPQRHGLNAGLWQDLEQRIATNYPARYGEVWVLTGPVVGPAPARLQGRVAVPVAFYKIIVDEQDGRLRTLAFLVPQEAPTHAEPGRYLTTIAEIEARTGLDFLPALEDAAEREVEQRRAGRVW
jgi:endonuclease G